jgi:hypothetical protein
VPGASGTYNLAPFWRDEIFVLVHPQMAIWYFSTSQPMQLIAASAGGVASGALPQPDEVPFDVGGLDACARGVAPYSNGYPFTTATGATETLSATECKALAELDPFYGNGQSANLSARAQLIKPATPYGTPPSQTGTGVDSPVSIGTVTSNLTGIGDSNTSTYTSTVEDIVATSESQGITLGVKGPLDLGLNNQITLKQGSSIDTSQTMTLTYKDSTAMMYRSDVTDDGSIDDTVNRGYWPQVEIWQDSLFGSFLFRDPNAPVAPSSPTTATLESHPTAQPLIVPAQQPVQSKAVFTCP